MTDRPDLAVLSTAATQREWLHDGQCGIQTDERHIALTVPNPAKNDGSMQANAAFICALVNAYREKRLVDASAWRPIESARRDGRELLLLLTPSLWPQVAWSNSWWTAGFSVECKPVGWWPIPSLPKPPKEDE